MNMLYAAMFAHVMWVFFLYGWLTLYRMPAIWGIKFSASFQQHCKLVEPKISANLRNQFEWPLLFYVVCLLAIFSGSTSMLFEVSSIVFTLGRIGHSVIQIYHSSIRLRGIVFSINFIAVLVMWCAFMLQQF